MDLIGEIKRRNPKFAKALTEAKNEIDILSASPWAWFTSELKVAIPNFATARAKVHKVGLKDLIASAFATDVSPKMRLRPFIQEKSLNTLIIISNKLFFISRHQLTRRVLLEYACIGDKKPRWAKVLLYLCKKKKECTIQEIRKAIRSESLDSKVAIQRFPEFFRRNVHIQSSNKIGSTAYFSITEEFYQNVYVPIAPWLDRAGLEVFKEWKKKYHKVPKGE